MRKTERRKVNRRVIDQPVDEAKARWAFVDRALEDKERTGRVSPETWAILPERERRMFAPYAPEDQNVKE
jgi:hypothetical protein